MGWSQRVRCVSVGLTKRVVFFCAQPMRSFRPPSSANASQCRRMAARVRISHRTATSTGQRAGHRCVLLVCVSTCSMTHSLGCLRLLSSGELYKAIAQVVATHLVPLYINTHHVAVATEQLTDHVLTDTARQIAQEQHTVVVQCRRAGRIRAGRRRRGRQRRR